MPSPKLSNNNLLSLELLSVFCIAGLFSSCTSHRECDRWLDTSACRAMARSLHPAPGRVHAYPWTELEAQLRRDGSRIALVGYGSLLHTDSARKNLDAHTVEQSFPVIVMGVRRVFEYVIPEGRMGGGPPAVALNTRYTADSCDLMNGRLFHITADDLAGLREREFGYDLVQVPWCEWPPGQARESDAWVLSCPGGFRNDKPLLNPSLMPSPVYLQLCRDGAARVSDRFADMFNRTTFLGDGRSIKELVP